MTATGSMIAKKTVENNLLERIEQLERMVRELQKRPVVAQSLSQITHDAGEIRAGQIIAGDDGDPYGNGDPFTGVAMLYPPVTIGGIDYHFIGMNAGVLQFAARATDGKIMAGAENVFLDADGVSVVAEAVTYDKNSYKFIDPATGEVVSYLNAIFSATRNFIGVEIFPKTGRVSDYSVKAKGGTGQAASIKLLVQQNASAHNNALEMDLTKTEINAGYGDYDTQINGANNPVILVDASEDAADVTIRKLNLKLVTATIAAGVISFTNSYTALAPEGGAATDDLDTVSGGADGDLLFLRTGASGKTVTVKDNVGNIRLDGGDVVLDNPRDELALIYHGSVSAWVQYGKGNNA